jgi:microcystin-dependent protein
MASDTFSPLLGLLLQGTGNNDNTWGDNLNNDVFLPIENALAGRAAFSVTGGAHSLSDTERVNAILDYSGILASDETVTVPNLSNKWLVRNATTGNFALKFKTASGTAVSVRQGGWSWVWCDGDDNIYVGPSSANFDTQLQLADGTVGAPGIAFSADLDTGIYRIGDNEIGVGVNGTKILDISTTGLSVTGSLLIGGERPLPVGTVLSYDGIYCPNGFIFGYGQALSRTTYSELYGKLTATATATRSNGSNSLSGVSVDLRNLGLIGAKIEGTGIPSGTTITGIGSNSITMSSNASGSGSMTITIFPHGNGDGSTTFNAPNWQDYIGLGRGDMSGTDRGGVTSAGSGIDGTILGTVGGAETVTLTEAKLPALTKTLSLSDPSHTHSIAGGNDIVGDSTLGPGSMPAGSVFVPAGTHHAVINSASTGITGTVSFGSGQAHNNMPPVRVTNKIIFTGVYS